MPKLIVTGDGKRLIDTGLPQRQIKPLWLEMHKEMNLKIIDAIINTESSTGRSVKTIKAVKFCIANILDDDLRTKLKAKIKQELEEKTSGATSMEDKLSIMEDVYLDAFECVTDYIDQAFGISHRIAIGID